MPTTQAYIYWRGVRMDQDSIPSLLMAEKLSKVKIRPTQGGYNRGGVAASAGTHDGGAVIDISTAGMSSAQRTSLLVWLRRCGWAAWLRTPAQGFIFHIHAVRCGDGSASRGAKAQVVAYKLGRNGLANNRADDGPKVGYVEWKNSKYNPANAKPKPASGPFKGFLKVDAINRKFPSHVIVLQRMLRAAGETIAIDGKFGPQTQACLDRYRRRAFPKWPVRDTKGPVGMKSLTALRNNAIKKKPKEHWPPLKQK